MPTPEEPDFPPGHPARADYDPDSKEGKEYTRKHFHPKGERDFPVDHPKAEDTPGNTNHLEWTPGVDPLHPELEPFSGRDPETAARVRKAREKASAKAKPSPVPEPTEAPPPPVNPGSIEEPKGQPGEPAPTKGRGRK